MHFKSHALPLKENKMQLGVCAICSPTPILLALCLIDGLMQNF